MEKVIKPHNETDTDVETPGENVGAVDENRGTGGSHSLPGTGSEWNPDVVAIESMYRDHYAGWSTHRPAEVARIHARLETEYRWDYSEGEYEVYLRIRP